MLHHACEPQVKLDIVIHLFTYSLILIHYFLIAKATFSVDACWRLIWPNMVGVDSVKSKINIFFFFQEDGYTTGSHSAVVTIYINGKILLTHYYFDCLVPTYSLVLMDYHLHFIQYPSLYRKYLLSIYTFIILKNI